jgi:hypothetical protein
MLARPKGERKEFPGALPGLGEDVINSALWAKTAVREGVPFGSQDVNVPLWGNYSALIDPF